VNATFAQKLSAVDQECASSAPAPASAPAPSTTPIVAPAPTPHTNSSTTNTKSSGSASLHEQIKGGIWIGVITLSVIVVGYIGLA